MRGFAYGWILLAALACSSPPDPRADAGPLDDAGPPPVDAGPSESPWLEDVTASAGIAHDVPDRFEDLPDRMGGGVCVIDVDGADPLDLVFALRDGLHLFVASAPLAYAEETAARGLDGVEQAMGCLAFDADGDGDDDLLVTAVGAVRLFLGEGGAFAEATDRLGLDLDPRDMYASAAAGDVDGDGDVDLLVAGAIRFDPSVLPPDCETCAAKVERFEPIPNLLLLRGPDGRYALEEDLAPDLMLSEPTLAVAITDLDGDGVTDLYVGNDLGHTYHDRALVFDGVIYRDHYLLTGLGYDARGHGIDTMGFSSADIDGNGRIDHVATAFEDHATAVFLCGEDGFCEPQRGDESGTAALAATFRWGAALVDLDLDGRPELFEAAGHIERDEMLGDRTIRRQPPNLMRNAGGRFEPVAFEPGSGVATPRDGRGVAVLDADLDGRPDLALAAATGAPALFSNAREPRGRPLVIALDGAPPNTGGLGARVTVRAGDRTLVQDRRAGEGYLGSFSPRLFFGVPDPTAEVEVRWPSGVTTRVDAAADGRVVRITE